MASVQKITPCLWFDNEGEDAAKLYVSVFDNSALGTVTRYGKEGFEIHGRPAGSVMTVTFRIAGQDFIALNGGPHFKISEAVSFVIHCKDQAEVDRYWERLGAGGDPKAQACGWLKDKFGVSWQVVPSVLFDMIADPDRAKFGRVMTTLHEMKKLDVAALKRAYEGK